MVRLADIAAGIAQAEGRPIELTDAQGAGGGCINRACVVRSRDGRRYFVKLNQAHRLAMFEAEAAGLEEIRATGALRAPRPIACGVSAGEAWLALEYLDLGGGGDPALLGRRLAQMHRHTAREFGWQRDNTIGRTPQINTPTLDWIAFYRERRLRPQYRLAAENGAPRQLMNLGERLLETFAGLFDGYRPQPSLLHGDLWGGNYAYCDGEPVVFDPAVYYGDREADLAMTELFGGFPAEFYAAYREAWPLDAGYRVRRELYNLYHVLNHYNLFGGGYLAQAQRMTERLLAELSA